MWRPKDWKNPTPNLIDDIAYDAYEDGANAMLEVLKKRAIDPHEIRTYEFDKTNPLRVSFGDDTHFGFVVFIPDEEVI